ncbi:MAG: YvyF: flagellar operon protein [Firmicutes bacterium]|nr:YvyF: flagellar operon protein [Bacillota bacterium]
MKLANCNQCGAVYVENPQGLCLNCLREEEEAEDKVAGFLREKDRASLEDIHQGTGVKYKIILRMLKRGRISSNAVIEYPCETCGSLISEGRICENCSNNITQQIKHEEWRRQVDTKPKPKDDGKVRPRLHIKDLLDNK